MKLGEFTQLTDDVGIVVVGEDNIPPIALAEPVQPEGWAFLGEVLEFAIGHDGWLEVYVYQRQE